MKTSIITNGSKINKKWLFEYGKYLDIIGISCDRASEETLIQLGRGNGNSASHTKFVFELIEEFNSKFDHKIFTKLNSVITKLNFNEDMKIFVSSLNVKRWKIFQILKIEGENDKYFDDLKISNQEFNIFIKNHLELNQKGTAVIPESNEDMTESYLMINPNGELYQNSNGKYFKSKAIHKVGFENAIQEIQFSFEKFISRNGDY